tara:strand:+ start:1232 stop:1429 length:198 start_codon:yes stop_codon:yes gene_type:complete
MDSCAFFASSEKLGTRRATILRLRPWKSKGNEMRWRYKAAKPTGFHRIYGDQSGSTLQNDVCLAG